MTRLSAASSAMPGTRRTNPGTIGTGPRIRPDRVSAQPVERRTIRPAFPLGASGFMRVLRRS